MLLFSHLVEFYYLGRHFLAPSLPFISQMLPPIGGDLVNLQPSLFALTSVHLIFDDSRARLSPEQGGLGYRGAWTTLQALCKTFEEYQRSGGQGEERSKGGGVSFGFGLIRAERSVGKVTKGLNMEPAKMVD